MFRRAGFLLIVSTILSSVILGCGGGGGRSKEEMLALISKVMGMAGGMLSYGAHVTIVVDPGTVAEDTLFTISEPTSVPPPPAGKEIVPGTAYDLGPSGVAFAKPVHVFFGYTVTPTLPPQNSLRLYKATGDTWTEVPGSTVDTTAHQVKADLNSFSTYAILGDASRFSALLDAEVFEVATVTATRAAVADMITITATQTGLDPFQLQMIILNPAVGTQAIGTDRQASIIDGFGAIDHAIGGTITITAVSAASIEGTATFNGNIYNVTNVAFRLPVTAGGP